MSPFSSFGYALSAAMNVSWKQSSAAPGPAVAPGMPTVLVAEQPTFPSPGESTTLRRLTPRFGPA